LPANRDLAKTVFNLTNILIMTTSDYIKEKLIEFNLKSKKTNLFHPNLQRTSHRYFNLKMSTGATYRIFDFTEKIVIETAIKTCLLFTVNLPDKICLADKKLNTKTGLKIYSSNTKDLKVIDCVNLIKKEIIDLRLQNNEGIYIYGNGITLNLNNSRELKPEILILQNLKSIIEDNFPENQEITDPFRLPTNLRNLAALFSEWAIQDDLEREEKIQKSSKIKLKRLIDLVYPKMDEINKYLDSFKTEPMPDEAILVGSLAELVSELINMKRFFQT